MRKRMLCLLLSCLLLTGALCACASEQAAEMTAVTIGTEEAAEKTDAAKASEASEADEKKADPAPARTDVTVTQAPTEAPIATESPTEATLPAVSMPPETEPDTPTANELRSAAMHCIGSDVSVLYNLIGYPPNGSSYRDAYDVNGNCIGEDGVLYYDGFTVYTFRDQNAERVMSVG